MIIIELKNRQLEILQIVKQNQPITSENIAKILNVSRSALRSDLSILTMAGMLEAKPKVGYFYVSEEERKKISNYLHTIRSGNVMSLPVVIDEKATVYEAIVMMFLEDVGSLYVVSSGYLAGVVSRKDLLKAMIGGADINKVPISVIMTRMPNIVMCYPTESIYEAAEKILLHQIDSVPIIEEKVINGEGFYKVIGRVSKTNITNQFVEIGK